MFVRLDGLILLGLRSTCAFATDAGYRPAFQPDQ